MSDGVFVIRNQLGQFWARAGEWADGREPQRLLKLKHHDEAVNQLVELSAKDIDLRGEVLACTLNGRGEPVVEVSAHSTPTAAERAAAQALLAEPANDSSDADSPAADDSDETGEPPVSAAV